jgi:hypothetical protein
MSLHQQTLHLVSYYVLIKRCLLAYRSADEPAPASFTLSFLFRLDQTLPAGFIVLQMSLHQQALRLVS